MGEQLTASEGDQALVRYALTASGANTARIRPAVPSAMNASSATGPPVSRPRTASVRWVTGLTLTHARSQPGIVSAEANMLEPNVNGNSAMKPIPCTEPASRETMPSQIEIQHRHQANTST